MDAHLDGAAREVDEAAHELATEIAAFFNFRGAEYAVILAALAQVQGQAVATLFAEAPLAEAEQTLRTVNTIALEQLRGRHRLQQDPLARLRHGPAAGEA